MYTVYKHTAPSGRVYIGITSLSVEKRWQNGNGYKDCTLFCHAIKKYGWENIDHEIVATGLTREDACVLEKHLINKYKLEDKSYNCSSGGELTAHGCVRTEQFKHKLSIANKGKHLSHETRQKLRESHKGKTPTITQAVIEGRRRAAEKLTGRIFTDEHRKNLSNAKKNKRTGAEHSQSVKILCLTDGKTYNGISEAARCLCLDASSICKVCKGKLKHYKGFVFEYAIDVK